MADVVLAYLQKHGVKVVQAALQRAIGKTPSFVTDEPQYRQAVIQFAWERLAPPVRMFLRNQYPRWDGFCLALRDEVFDLSESAVTLRPNAEARIAALLDRFFSENAGPGAAQARSPSEGEAVPSLALRACVPAPPPDGPPLAMPVLTAANPALAVPIAHPVASLAPAPAVPQPAPRNGHPIAAAAAVGIDLGTTYSVVAYLDAQGRPCSIPNAAGDVLTPSVVLFDEGGTVVGKEAVQASALEPEKVAECAKRDMGARVYRKKINGEFLPPEMISSLVLRSLKADAERRLGAAHRAVITVPAYFDERRRRATMEAGRMAGLEVLDILNEPTAAAIAYGYQLGFLDRSCRAVGDRPLRVLVFDLGGGTFDVTIVELKANDFWALATDGDVALGGKDWDEKLVGIAAERSRHHFREDPRDNPVSLQDLWLAAEAAKRTLTERPKAALYVNHLGSRCKVEVTRAEFEEATAALLERTRLTTEVVVRQAGLAWADIDRVLLVGGSTRMPMVVRMLEELSGRPPDEAVAHGAALYAALLAPPAAAEAVAPAFKVTNVNSHSLGILGADPKSRRKFNKILLPKNSPLPRTVSKVCRTGKPNQRNVVIKVLEGESERPEVCTLVGECAVRDLPAGLPAGWPVRVSYTYEANGRLHVTAKVKGHGSEVAADFTHENSLPDEEVELWTHLIEEELRASS